MATTMPSTRRGGQAAGAPRHMAGGRGRRGPELKASSLTGNWSTGCFTLPFHYPFNWLYFQHVQCKCSVFQHIIWCLLNANIKVALKSWKSVLIHWVYRMLEGWWSEYIIWMFMINTFQQKSSWTLSCTCCSFQSAKLPSVASKLRDRGASG